MSGSFPRDPWEPSILPALDMEKPTVVRAFQRRAVAFGAQANYTLDQQRDLLEQLGLLPYAAKPGRVNGHRPGERH